MKRLVVVILLVVSPVVNAGYTYSDYTWKSYGGKEYALTLDAATWPEAEAEAVAVGGHLVTINDESEDMWLYENFHSSSESVWIGLYQDHDHPDYSEPAGGWVWISGEPVTYTGWGGDEPNNGYGSGEDYGCFHTAGWYWNDWAPDNTVHGIIELPEPAIEAAIDIDADALNLKSKGRWITCYIELPEDYNVEHIDVSTIKLNDEVPAEPHPTGIGDCDDDGTPDLMVKFDRSAVQQILQVGDEVQIKVTGELNDGTPFEGSDTIRVIDNGGKK